MSCKFVELLSVLCQDLYSLLMLLLDKFNDLLIDLSLCLCRACERSVSAEILVLNCLHSDHVEVITHAVAGDHRSRQLGSLLDIVRSTCRH